MRRVLPLLMMMALGRAEAGERSPQGVLRVYLVRHGQALSNLRPTGREPEPALDHLTALGREQSREAGRALRGLVRRVVSSPAGRAREAARELASAADCCAATVDERLQPMRLGQAADGRALVWRERLDEWTAGRDPVPSQGESFAQVGARVLALMRELGQDGGGVALVAHGDVIAPLLAHVRGGPAPRELDRLDNATVSLVEMSKDGSLEIVFVNRPASEVQRGTPP